MVHAYKLYKARCRPTNTNTTHIGYFLLAELSMSRTSRRLRSVSALWQELRTLTEMFQSLYTFELPIVLTIGTKFCSCRPTVNVLGVSGNILYFSVLLLILLYLS